MARLKEHSEECDLHNITHKEMILLFSTMHCNKEELRKDIKCYVNRSWLAVDRLAENNEPSMIDEEQHCVFSTLSFPLNISGASTLLGFTPVCVHVIHCNIKSKYSNKLRLDSQLQSTTRFHYIVILLRSSGTLQCSVCLVLCLSHFIQGAPKPLGLFNKMILAPRF